MSSWTRLSGFIFSKLLSRFPNPVMVSGSSDEQVVALTFDDGPHPPFTQEILDILDNYQVTGTFFLLGQAVRKYPALAGEVTIRGHAIGAHTYSHPLRIRRNPLHFEREIVRTHRLIAGATGQKPELFRPPRGRFDPMLFMGVRIMMGYTVVLWSVSAKDWREDSAEAIAARVVADIEPGGIVCLHDGCGDAGDGVFEDRSQTVLALPMIIEQLRSQGYRFVTIPELIGIGQYKGLA